MELDWKPTGQEDQGAVWDSKHHYRTLEALEGQELEPHAEVNLGQLQMLRPPHGKLHLLRSASSSRRLASRYQQMDRP